MSSSALSRMAYNETLYPIEFYSREPTPTTPERFFIFAYSSCFSVSNKPSHYSPGRRVKHRISFTVDVAQCTEYNLSHTKIVV
jgi:organic hydroperoxide reductase OsmC/OhrA